MNHRKLRKLAEQATHGPWFRSAGRTDEFDIWHYEIGPVGTRENLHQYEDTICECTDAEHDGARNGAYIAACDPNTIIGLLDEIANLKKKIKKLKGSR
jgi:hypothetical protein